MLRRRDQTDLLARVQVPLLLVVGVQDVITPPAVVRGVREHAPHAMLVEVDRAGHLANLEQPGAVNAAIQGFMQAHVAGG